MTILKMNVRRGRCSAELHNGAVLGKLLLFLLETGQKFTLQNSPNTRAQVKMASPLEFAGVLLCRRIQTFIPLL